MAVSAGGITYDVSVETAALLAAEKQVASSSNKMQTSLTAVAQATQAQAAAARLSEAAIREATRAEAAAASAANQHAAAAGKSADAMNKQGMSAKALAAATRNLPAQFTDIVTGLGSGQSPFTVLLQQGGQLKDMFGGVGGAARALGGYIAGLVSPLTLAAGAAAAYVVGLVKGREETDEFRKTVTLTGHASGVTADALNTLAARMDDLEGVTRGKAAEALNEFAAAGVRGEQALGRISEAAIRLEQAGGPAVADTAKAFKELAKDPLAASLKLNDSVNFLTQSIYTQIKALTDQGRQVEAAKVAQDAYADAILSRAPALIDNVGFLERAWRGVANAAKEAWDNILNVGRQDTPEQAMAGTLKQIELIERQLSSGGFGNTGAGAATGRGLGKKQREDLEAQLAALKEQAQLYQRAQSSAKTLANEDAKRLEQVKALAEFNKEGEKFLDKRAKMDREIKQARAMGKTAQLEEVKIEERIAAIRKSYEEKKEPFDVAGYLSGLSAAAASEWDRVGIVEEEAIRKTATHFKGLQGMEAQQAQAVELIRAAAANRRVELLQKEADKEKVAMEKAARDRQRQAMEDERLRQTISETEILATQNVMARIDLVRAESFRRADALARAGAITYAQAEAEKARAAVSAQNDIREAVLSINPLAALQQEYEQKLSIVKFYEQQMAQAGVDGATFVEEKRLELAYQYQQQRQALAEAEFIAQGEGQRFLIDSLNSLQATATNSITGLITGTMTAADAMRNLGMVVLNEAVGALVQIGVQYLKNALMGQAADKAMMASKAVNASLYSAAISAQVAVTTALAAQNAFAATAAIPIVGPAAAPGAASAAAAAATALGAAAIASAPVAGARMYGGSVDANSLYRVGEKGPEMFIGRNGNAYMTPGQGGKVVSNDEIGGGWTINILNAPPGLQAPNVDYRRRQIDIDMAAQQAVATVAEQIGTNTGPVWSALTGATNVRSQI